MGSNDGKIFAGTIGGQCPTPRTERTGAAAFRRRAMPDYIFGSFAISTNIFQSSMAFRNIACASAGVLILGSPPKRFRYFFVSSAEMIGRGAQCAAACRDQPCGMIFASFT
jgi:hypothetical protein